MQGSQLYKIVSRGPKEEYPAGQVFYSLDFKEEIYVVLKGYVKRVQINDNKKRVIESVYGPEYFFPLSQVYRSLFHYNLNQDHITYTYEAITDVEIAGISIGNLIDSCNNDPLIYKDLLFEAGRRLTANINRLASNALLDDYQKIAHQLVSLAIEFGVESTSKEGGITVKVPLDPATVSEQVNVSIPITAAVLDSFVKQGLIRRHENRITINSLEILRDVYL